MMKKWSPQIKELKGTIEILRQQVIMAQKPAGQFCLPFGLAGYLCALYTSSTIDKYKGEEILIAILEKLLKLECEYTSYTHNVRRTSQMSNGVCIYKSERSRVTHINVFSGNEV